MGTRELERPGTAATENRRGWSWIVALGLRLDSGDGIEIFLPLLALGTVVLAGTLQRLEA